MKIIISAKLQGAFETYKILVDGKVITKVRGDKETTLEVSDEEHNIQLKSASGKSSIIQISPKEEKNIITLKFITKFTRAFKEGYFELMENAK